MKHSIRRRFPLSAAVLVAIASGGAGSAVPSRGPHAAAATAQQRDGQRLYQQLCATCHGQEGRGDGPAAVAFSPRPPDLTSPVFQSSRTDEQLAEVLRRGKGQMPSFGSQLSDAERAAVIRYVRQLGSCEGPRTLNRP
jgi:mono/diheme cytochrome c family protein